MGAGEGPDRGDSAEAGTVRLFTDWRFPTKTGRAQFHAPPDGLQSELPDEAFPLILTTGRIRDQWHTMTKTGKVARLRRHQPQSVLEMHPEDACPLGIGEGDIVLVESRRGEVRVPVRLTGNVKKGSVFLPMHWGTIQGSGSLTG